MVDTSETSGSESFQPLSQCRVLDFTWSVLGPTLTRNLAGLGAEVIKVEWPRNPDPMRKVMYARGETDPGLDNGPFFNNLNVGKRSFTLDAKSERGRGIIRRLIAQCDVVAESFSSQVFRSWGLGYEDLRAINPRIVYISASGFGHSGPRERYETWGPTAQALTGVTATSGEPGHQPAGWGWSYLDTMGGAMATVGVLAALLEARSGGEGQYIDLSQTDIGVGLTGPSFLDVMANGRALTNEKFPPGNRAVSVTGSEQVHGYRSEHGAPYGCYPTRGGGHNDFFVISVLSDEEWLRLVDVMGQPEWVRAGSFATTADRIRQQDQLDAHISTWTSQHDKYELLEELQARRIRCAPVQSNMDLLERDPQLAHRELYPSLTHPLLGEHRYEAMPLGPRGSRLAPQWPLLGESNEYVLREVLGLSSEEVEDLDASGVTWPLGLDRHIPVERPTW